MNKVFSLITLIFYGLIGSSLCLAMDSTVGACNSCLLDRAPNKTQLALKLLKDAHARNDPLKFKSLLTEQIKPVDLEAIWPDIMKMTIHNTPTDMSTSQANPKFSKIINNYNKKLESPLHQAARNGELDILRKFINNQNINTKNLNGESVLFTAVFAEQLEIVRMLLGAGADPCAQITLGMGPLHISNNVGITQLLYEYGAHTDLNTQDAFGQSPLFRAIGENKPVIATLLINMGAQVDLSNFCGETPLHGACCNDFLKPGPALALCKKLIDSGANVNAQSNDNRTPLHLAIENRLLAMVHLLLTNGADVTLEDSWDTTPASLIKEAWNVTPEAFIKIYNKPNFKELFAAHNRALAQKSFEHTPPTHTPKVIKGKKPRKNKNVLTYNQRKEKAPPLRLSTADLPSIASQQIIDHGPIIAKKKVLALVLDDRVTNWKNDEWLDAKKQNAQAAGVYAYWQFLRERLYHRLPEEALSMLLAQGAQKERPNATYKGHNDMQYILEGEMQFEHFDNPWCLAKRCQPGFYHMTRGNDNKIYHVGFKPIPARPRKLGDFMPQNAIPLEWADGQAPHYVALYDAQEGVRHVLYLK